MKMVVVMKSLTLNNLLRAATFAFLIYFVCKIALLPYEVYRIDKKVEKF